MDHSKSPEKYPLLLISCVSLQPGTFTTSFTCRSYLPIVKRTHTDPTTRGCLLTLLKEKKNMKSKRSLIIGALAGLEPSSTSSSGWGTHKQITPGNQLTRSILHNMLTPTTDSILSNIKRSEPSQNQPSTLSSLLHHVCRWICQP